MLNRACHISSNVYVISWYGSFAGGKKGPILHFSYGYAPRLEDLQLV